MVAKKPPPNLIRTGVPVNSDEAGCSFCGICRCCTCVSLGFLSTPTGLVKIIELLFGVVSQFLLLRYGMEYDSLSVVWFVFIISLQVHG